MRAGDLRACAPDAVSSDRRTPPTLRNDVACPAGRPRYVAPLHDQVRTVSTCSIRSRSPGWAGIEVVTEGVVEGFLSGLHRSPRRGFSVEFAEHRMYQPGDELRYVDWKILGRNDRLYVKQFEEETNLRAMVVCDISRSMAWTGDARDRPPQARLRPATDRRALAWCCSGSGTPPASSPSTTRCGPCCRRARGSATGASWCRRSAELQAGQGTAAEPALRRVVDQLRRRGLVVFVSDLLLDRDLALKALRFLRHRGHQVLRAAPHGSGRARLSADRRRRGSRTPRPARRSSSGRGTGPAPTARPSGTSSASGGSPAAATASRYHRVTTDTPVRHRAARGARARRPARAMIGFLHPWALVGLAAAAIPVLLHLLARREPPTVVFPAVRYLITTTQEHQRRLKLQNLLLLLLRTLLDRRPRARGGRTDAAAARRAGPRAERAGADPGQLAQQRRDRRGIAPAGAAPRRRRAGARPRDAGRRALARHRRRRAAARGSPRRCRVRSAALRWSRPDGSISVRRSRLADEVLAPASRARARSCCSPTSRPRAVSPARARRAAASWAVPTTPPPPNVGHRAARDRRRSPGPATAAGSR